MKCPHCSIEFHVDANTEKFIFMGRDSQGDWAILKNLCPNKKCNKIILELIMGQFDKDSDGWKIRQFYSKILVWPKTTMRAILSPEVPKEFANDYKEACLVLSDSPKASAALSRRCLQHILREVAHVKQGDLFDEIQQIIEKGNLPSYLIETIDAVRNIGNFAAHPIKSKSTSEIVPVEPGEAEWNLSVLESLFDFYFVQPAIIKKKREALNKKLEDAGKKKMK